VLNHAIAGDEAALDRVVNAEGSAGAGESTDHAIARFDGTDGALQDSAASVDDSGAVVCTGVIFPASAEAPTVSQADQTVDSTNGENAGLVAQSATGDTSDGGDAYIQPGTGTGSDGSGQVRNAAGEVLVRVLDDKIAFYNGTPTVAQQTVTGLTTDPAVINLFAALEALGLIVDGHTES
jgi:hypothetical protein